MAGVRDVGHFSLQYIAYIVANEIPNKENLAANGIDVIDSLKLQDGDRTC